MLNYYIIQIMQVWPSKAARIVSSLRGKKKKLVAKLGFIEGIDHFETEQPKQKLAIVTLSPEAWETALEQHPNIKMFNYVGLTYSIVKSLNLNGYLVDLVDWREAAKPEKSYDVAVCHGPHCRDLIEGLQPSAVIYQYVSGAYYDSFNKESEERYARFYRNNLSQKPKNYTRDIRDLKDGEKFLTDQADVLFTINCPRMIKTFGENVGKFYFTGLGAYIDPLLTVRRDEKDFCKGRKNFLYVGGTGGNLQKGIDLLIEIFAEIPEVNLYIYCKIEDDILTYRKAELSAPNIHYIYHWRYKPFQNKLKGLLKVINFSVHAPINIGMGTAFMGTLGAGMIPVGYVDLTESENMAITTENWDIVSLRRCIIEASERTPEWCEDAYNNVIKYYMRNCDPDTVADNLREMFSK